MLQICTTALNKNANVGKTWDKLFLRLCLEQIFLPSSSDLRLMAEANIISTRNVSRPSLMSFLFKTSPETIKLRIEHQISVHLMSAQLRGKKYSWL